MNISKFFIIILFILLSATGGYAGSEPYSVRPDILKTKTQAHPELTNISPSWNSLKNAHVEAIAEFLVMYPDEELYFLARDAESLYDFAKLILKDRPDQLKRIHLLNVNRVNSKPPTPGQPDLLIEYLEQEGISVKALERGKKFVFFDTGLSGTIPRNIETRFPKKFSSNFKSHLIVSKNVSIPSSRAFVKRFDPATSMSNPWAISDLIIRNYEELEHYTDRSTGFERVDGLLQPISLSDHITDGKVSKEIAVKYMEDQRSYFESKDIQEILQNRINRWTELKNLIDQGNAQRLKDYLTRFLAKNEPYCQELVQDLYDIVYTNFWDKRTLLPEPSEIGLNSLDLDLNSLELIHQYPDLDLKDFFLYPYGQVVKMLERKKFSEVKQLLKLPNLHVAQHISPIFQALGRNFEDPFVAAGAREVVNGEIDDLLKTRPQDNWIIARHVLSQPGARDWKSEVQKLIKTGIPIVLKELVQNAFKRLHAADWRAELLLLIKLSDKTIVSPKQIKECPAYNSFSYEQRKVIDQALELSTQKERSSFIDKNLKTLLVPKSNRRSNEDKPIIQIAKKSPDLASVEEKIRKSLEDSSDPKRAVVVLDVDDTLTLGDKPVLNGNKFVARPGADQLLQYLKEKGVHVIASSSHSIFSETIKKLEDIHAKLDTSNSKSTCPDSPEQDIDHTFSSPEFIDPEKKEQTRYIARKKGAIVSVKSVDRFNSLGDGYPNKALSLEFALSEDERAQVEQVIFVDDMDANHVLFFQDIGKYAPGHLPKLRQVVAIPLASSPQ